MPVALLFALANDGNSIPAKMAMIAITTRSSMRVKPVTKRLLGKRLSWAERHFGEIRFTKNLKNEREHRGSVLNLSIFCPI
jgi:hypothetical protein